MDKLTQKYAPVYQKTEGGDWFPCVPRGADDDAAYKYPYRVGIKKTLKSGRYYLYDVALDPCSEFVERMRAECGAVNVGVMRVFGVGDTYGSNVTYGLKAEKYKGIVPLEIVKEVKVPKGIVLTKNDLEVRLDCHGDGFDVHLKDKTTGVVIGSFGVDGLHKWNDSEMYTIDSREDSIRGGNDCYASFRITRQG